MKQPEDVRIHQSVAILVDGNNIEISLHNLLGNDDFMVNFDTLIPELLGNRGLNRLIYFREGESISHKRQLLCIQIQHGKTLVFDKYSLNSYF